VCRAEQEIPERERAKLALFCNVRPEAVIAALDLNSIYEAPLALHAAGLDRAVLDAFGIAPAPRPALERWERVMDAIERPDGAVRIAVVGKYTQLGDAYKSLAEALTHAGIANRVTVRAEWLDSEVFEREDAAAHLEGFHGIIVPGGFGERGAEGKVRAARFARERKVPYLGICLGMQMAVIEAARDLAGIPGAGSQEFDHEAGAARFEHVIYHLSEWVEGDRTVRRKATDAKGGTMRLGAYDAVLTPGSRAAEIYGAARISERHRHRYEFNNQYQNILKEHGLQIAGVSPDGELVEMIEVKDHPWFVGCQFHPEFKSRPMNAHPLFRAFVKASLLHKQRQGVSVK